MKIIFALALVVISFVSAHSQNKSMAGGKVIYSFTHARDTNNLNFPYKEEMMLTFNANTSLYKSYTAIIEDSLMRAAIEKSVNNNENPSINVKKVTREQFYYFFNDSHRYWVLPWFRDTLAIKGEIEEIDWSITGDTKMIAGFKSIKATCTFKGRNFEAWFCPEIPVKAGPWKLNGLPGLILEAKDDKGQVKFEFMSLRNEQTATIALPAQKTFVTKEKFQQMQDAVKQNPAGFINAALGGVSDGSGSSSFQITKMENTGKPKSSFNNPLELKD